MSGRGEYEPLDPENQGARRLSSSSKRSLIIVGACTLLLAGVVMAVTLPSNKKVSDGNSAGSGNLVQSGMVVPAGSSASTENGPVTHREFLKTLCNFRKNGPISWGYWDSNSAESPESIDSPESRESPESFNSPESLESLDSPESDNDSGFAWWKNPFIPKSKRLWLEFLHTNGLLHQTHRNIPYDEFVKMWMDFLGNRNVATAPDTSDTGDVGSNPFIPEFKKLWLEFLQLNGLMNETREHIPHDQFIRMWNDFLAERGVTIPAPEAPVAAEENSFAPESSMMEQFWKLRGIKAASKPVNEGSAPDAWKNNPFIPKGVKLWLEFLESSGMNDPAAEPLPEGQLGPTWSDFLAEWGITLPKTDTKGVTAVEGSAQDAWKNNPFIPKGVKLWLEFLESSGMNDPTAEPLPEGQLGSMWSDFLAEQGITIPKTGTKGVTAVERSAPDAWKNNPFIPKGKKLWLEFLESSGVNDPTAEPLPEGQLGKMWSDFLAERGIVLPPRPVSASAQVSHDEFLQWWLTNLNSGRLTFGPIAATTVKKSTSVPHEQFVSWWKQFLQDQANSNLYVNEQRSQEDFINWWLAEMQDRFDMVGTSEAKAQHIPHEQFLDLMCDSLLTGTYDPQFPNAEETLPVPLADGDTPPPQAHEGERVDVKAIDTAARTAERVLRSVPLIDGHNDLAFVYRSRVQNHINDIDLQTNVSAQWGPSHTDIPRMQKGLMGGQFWSVFVQCNTQYLDSVRVTLDQFDTVKRFVDKYDDDFMFVTQSYEIWEAFNRGKIASMIGIEGGHSIDSSMATLRMYYDLGARYMTLTHFCNTPWADASPVDSNLAPGEGDHSGLTVWGRRLVREMNRLGMMVDLSHVSYNTMNDVLNFTLAPVIFSHSSAWELCHHHRNVRDDVLRKVALNGGIVMVNFYNKYINCAPNEMPKATLSQVADHIEHIRDVAGIDYVGIGSDFDGSAYEDFPEGLSDVSFYPDLFAELAHRDWTDEDLKKLAGLNLIRVFKTVEVVRDRLKDNKLNTADDALIPKTSIPDNSCRPDF